MSDRIMKRLCVISQTAQVPDLLYSHPPNTLQYIHEEQSFWHWIHKYKFILTRNRTIEISLHSERRATQGKLRAKSTPVHACDSPVSALQDHKSDYMNPSQMTETEHARQNLLSKLADDVSDSRVLDAMRRVPRERFVTPATADLAYQDIALPIPAGQTISQPTMVAIMVAELELRMSDKVLEIGAGSGYQAAILSELAREVITLERIPELAESARTVLSKLGYRNVRVELAGPRLGREEDAPYNAIIVAAAAPRLPLSLLDQMEPGGRLVVPVGDRLEQTLMKIVKGAEGFTTRTVTACRFVPLIAEDAWPDDSAVSTVL